MSKKALFVLNPHSGKGLIKYHLLDIVDILVKAGYEVNIYPTQSRGDATRKVKERKKSYELVVCSGGDGTLDEIITGIMSSGFKTPIGYIPSGSTNDFGASLNIPTNMRKAADIAANGDIYACDVGRFNDDVFAYIAAFGIFTEVSYGTPQEMKNAMGHMAYILEAVRHLQSIKLYKMKVTYVNSASEEVVIEDQFIYGMVTNAKSVGGFKNIIDNVFKGDVALNDGLFEVVLIRFPKNPVELNSILAALAIENIDTEFMYSFKSGDVIFESPGAVSWTLDGEYGGTHEKVHILNDRKALDIKVKHHEK